MHNTQKIIDISWPLSNRMTGYKNKQPFNAQFIKNFPDQEARESLVTLNSHAGTHLDAPAHFINEGVFSDQLDLTRLIGPCRVIELDSSLDAITKKNLEVYCPQKNERLLLKTKNSSYQPDALFESNFTFITKEAADYLVSCQIMLIGIDYLGIERNQPEHETHKIFFNHDTYVLEGLRLGHVMPGSYELICVPLAYQELEAAPARALLRSFDD